MQYILRQSKIFFDVKKYQALSCGWCYLSAPVCVTRETVFCFDFYGRVRISAYFGILPYHCEVFQMAKRDRQKPANTALTLLSRL